MKNLITLYQKYRNHFSAVLGIISTICLGVLTTMVFFGHVLPSICILILMAIALLSTIEITIEAIGDIRYGEDEYIDDNEYQIIINVRDAENTNIHELVEKINKALNNETEQ